MTVDSSLDVADRMFGAIAGGDYATVEATWADDVLVWHSGDTEDNPRGRALRVIRWFLDVTNTRSYEVLDRQVFDGGFVQQHILRAQGRNGASIEMRVCLVAKVNARGLVSRIDEYFDPSVMAPLLEN